MPGPRKPRASMVSMATVLVCISAALAQSVPDAPQSVAAAVVGIGVVALDPAADPSAPASMAGRPANINGSGFFVSKQGHVITALHVVRAAEHARDEMQGTDNRLFVGLRAGSSFCRGPGGGGRR